MDARPNIQKVTQPMSDISMCQNKECELKETCYRYLAIPFPQMQCYGDFKPVNGKCDYYWQIQAGMQVDKSLITKHNP